MWVCFHLCKYNVDAMFSHSWHHRAFTNLLKDFPVVNDCQTWSSPRHCSKGLQSFQKKRRLKRWTVEGRDSPYTLVVKPVQIPSIELIKITSKVFGKIFSPWMDRRFVVEANQLVKYVVWRFAVFIFHQHVADEIFANLCEAQMSSQQQAQ